MNTNTNGMIIWQGASPVDGAPIVAIVTGLDSKSANGKTGDMLQTWILLANAHPSEALASGADVSICGACPHRPRVVNGKRMRTCYVRMQAPPSVWKCYARGGYASVSDPRAIAALGRGRAVRLGSYGDPAMVPTFVWAALVSGARTHTGYTHQSGLESFDANLLALCMRSADSEAEARTAYAEGIRSFYVRPFGAPLPKGFAQCPAAEEAGRRATCADCGLCAGSALRARPISIQAHGNSKRSVA